MRIENNEDLDLLITAAFSDLNQGQEQLRMFDKFMTEVEQIAHVDYDENGNVRFQKSDALGRVIRDADGNTERLTKLKNDEPGELPLTNCREWIRGRLETAKWPGTHARRAFRLLEQLTNESEADE